MEPPVIPDMKDYAILLGININCLVANVIAFLSIKTSITDVQYEIFSGLVHFI